MREIKFRAWDTKHKEMLNSRDQGYQGEVFKWLKEGQPLEVMQFTGLHDRNGREIYEGDVVKYLGFEVRNGKQIRPERRILADSADWIKSLHRLQCISENNSTVEVIGNIYETPELCKG